MSIASALGATPPTYTTSLDRFAGMEMHAPVILLPHTFEPALCRMLIELYERRGGELTGFMREVDGKTRGIHDPRHKIRREANVQFLEHKGESHRASADSG